MKKSSFHKMFSLGFTLIELIVVVGAILLITGISIPYYNNFSQSKKLDQETKRLIDALELIRKKAYSSDLGGQTCANFIGYRADITATGYTTRLCCSDDCSTSFPYQTYVFQSGVAVETTQTNYVFFRLLNAGVQASSNTIKINNTATSTCKKITISSVGLIDEANTCP